MKIWLSINDNKMLCFNYFCLFCGHLCNRLFEEIDVNDDNHISRSEFEKIVKGIQFGKVVDAEDAASKLIQDLDIDRNNEISETEFVEGLTKWMNSNSSQAANSKSSSHENHQVCPLFSKKLSLSNFLLSFRPNT